MKAVLRTLAWPIAAAIVLSRVVQLGGPQGPERALASPALSVSGSVVGLLPGVPATLLVTVSNDDSAPAVVVHLGVEVAGGGTATCPVSALRIAPWRGRLLVPGRGSAGQVVPVLLSAAADCGDVRWSLRYTATT